MQLDLFAGDSLIHFFFHLGENLVRWGIYSVLILGRKTLGPQGVQRLQPFSTVFLSLPQCHAFLCTSTLALAPVILTFLKLKDKNRRPPLPVVASIIRKVIFFGEEGWFYGAGSQMISLLILVLTQIFLCDLRKNLLLHSSLQSVIYSDCSLLSLRSTLQLIMHDLWTSFGTCIRA